MTCLDQLLQQCARQQPEYGGGMSSHLPMALIALARMGASDERLRRFATDYSRRMALLPAADDVPVANWLALRGDIHAYPALLAYFRHELQQQPAAQVLRRDLPQLMPGVGAAAFHGLIRLAYGVLAESVSEIAAGLAYLAARYLPLGALAAGHAEWASPQAAYQALAGTQPSLPACDLIFESMLLASRLPAFSQQVAGLRITPDTLPQLAQSALQLFNVEANFVALHMVTSCHALRILLPYFDHPLQDAVPWLWQAHLAAFYAGKLGQQARIVTAGRPDAGFDAQTFAAQRARDDHCIKMVFTCREEAACYGDAAHAYEQAAQRVCASFG